MIRSNRTDPIVTSHVFPPIPDRRWDWVAYRDPEGLNGQGATEAEAIADLLEQEETEDDDTLADCDLCRNSGLVGYRCSSGSYVGPGPVPEDARGVAEGFCECGHGRIARSRNI